MKSLIYNQKGEKKAEIDLPEKIFGLPWNSDLVHQVVVSMQSNARTPVAHTKDRSDVRGGGKKPWRQKGTGRARHGSTRSPIWRGGGVTFGPRNNKNYSKKINKKMKTKALYTTLSQKLRDDELIFVDKISFTDPKTKEAKNVLESLAGIKGFEILKTKKKNTALITIENNDLNIKKSFNNFGNIEVEEVRNLNPVDLLKYKYTIIVSPEKSIEIIQKSINQEIKKTN